MSSPPEKFAISPKNGDHGSRHRPGSQFSRRRPAPSAQPAQDRTTHRESHHGGWGKQPISYGNPSFGQQGQDIPPTNCQPRQSPTGGTPHRQKTAVPRAHHPAWRRAGPDCGSSPAPASPGPLMRMSASSSPPTSFSSSTSSFCCVIKAIFCDGFQTFCTPFFFALYICTLHVTGVGDEMRRHSSLHAWAGEGEGSIASWHH